MPRSSTTILLLLFGLGLTMLVPAVGELVALFVLFVAAIALSVPTWIVWAICRQFGSVEHPDWIYAGAFVAIALACAAYFAFRSQSSAPERRTFYRNGVILALGSPVIIAIAVFHLRALFPATFHP